MPRHGDEQSSRTAGWILTALAVVATVAGLVGWAPLRGTLLDERFPYALTALELGALCAVCVPLCFTPPYHGAMLVPMMVMAGLVVGTCNAFATTYQTLAFGALGLPALGVVWLIACKTDGGIHARRPYWQEAWPGLLFVIVGLPLALGVATLDGPDYGLWLPPGVVPAEALP